MFLFMASLAWSGHVGRQMTPGDTFCHISLTSQLFPLPTLKPCIYPEYECVAS